MLPQSTAEAEAKPDPCASSQKWGEREKVEAGNFLLSKWCASHTNHSCSPSKGSKRGCEMVSLTQQPDPRGSSLPGGQQSSWNRLKSCSWFWSESERWQDICLGWSWQQGGRPGDFIWWRCSWEVSESRSCIVYQEEGTLSEEVLVQTSSLPSSPPQGC